MRHLALTLRHAFWMVCACVLLLPHVAAAEPSLPIDFDGDGRRDQVMLDQREPSVLHVSLSASDTTQLIRARVPLLQIVAADLDGDHRPELIARGSESQIHVWTRKGTRFHSYRPRDVVLDTLGQRNRGGVEDKDREPSGARASAPLAVTLRASLRTPGPEASPACAPHTARACRSLTAVEPFVPRPPPAHVPL